MKSDKLHNSKLAWIIRTAGITILSKRCKSEAIRLITNPLVTFDISARLRRRTSKMKRKLQVCKMVWRHHCDNSWYDADICQRCPNIEHLPLEPGISCLRPQKLDLIINVPGCLSEAFQLPFSSFTFHPLPFLSSNPIRNSDLLPSWCHFYI